MPTRQRYVAKELTHFVGRGMPEEQQYQTLLKVLASQALLHPPFDPRISGNIEVDISAPASENKMYNSQVVCFCDIPVGDDLEIHMTKYSRFGISFAKAFLIEKGATPVYYVPLPKGHVFDEALRGYYRGATELSPFFENQIASFIKFFDPAKMEDDADNYYMEREWRVLGNVHFTLRDVRYLLLPGTYTDRLRKDIPAFSGGVHLTD